MKDLGPLLVTLLSGGLITGIVGIVGLIVSLRNTQRSLQSQRETEDSRAQQDALQKYFDQISDLVLNQNLRPETKYSTPKGLQRYLDRARALLVNQDTFLSAEPQDSESKSYVRGLAQARTMAILAGIGPSFKRLVLTMVYEQELISRQDPVLQLKNAALAGANLSEITLREAHLSQVDLRVSDLKGADLKGCDLSLADLRGANLSRANLRYVDLTEANLLAYDEWDPERLSLHDLEIVNLRKESLRATRRLTIRNGRPVVSRPTTTNLSGAILVGARLHLTLLVGANLTNADLGDADLTGANLYKAVGVTSEQLKSCGSLEGATMPNGQKYEDWLKDREKRQQYE